MTNVSIQKSGIQVTSIKISGHAFFADPGNDIVCSAISMIAYTIGNQMILLDEKGTKVTINDGLFKISNDSKNDKIQLLFDTLILGLKMIEENYKNNINIKEVRNV